MACQFRTPVELYSTPIDIEAISEEVEKRGSVLNRQ